MNIDLNHAVIADVPAFALAIYLRRRAELNLTIDQAAERAGITTEEWCSFEHGHVPHYSDLVIRDLADALETSRMTVSFMACVAEYNQNRERAVPRRAQRSEAGRAPSARATNQHN